VNAIEMRALRKVYKGSGKSKRASTQGARWAPPGATAPPVGDVVALDALDLDIRAGEFFGLLGPNGAGKTTAIGILTTRVLPTAGKAFVAGADVVEDSCKSEADDRRRPTTAERGLSLNVLENPLFHAAYHGIAFDSKHCARRSS
jgi:ABC-2 type transport system ATP-binding protein